MLKFAVKRKPVELFHEAVHSKDLLRVTFLLEQNESQFHIDDIDEDGITALQRTCFTGPLNLVQLLVTYGADINIQDNEGWSVMHAATVARNHSVMRYLIAMGAPLGLENDQGELAIDLALDLRSVVILADGMRRAGLTREMEEFLRDSPEVREILEEKLRQSEMIEKEEERQRSASEILPPNISLNLDDTRNRRSSADNPRPVTTTVKPTDNHPQGLMDTRLSGVALPSRSPINLAGLDSGGRDSGDSCAFCPKCGKRRKQIVKRQSTVSLCSDSSDSSSSSDSAYSSGSTNSAGNLQTLEHGNVRTMTIAKQNNDFGAENHWVYDHVRATAINIHPAPVTYITNRESQSAQVEGSCKQRRFSSPATAKPNSSSHSQGRSQLPAINKADAGTVKFPHHERVTHSEEYHFSPRRHSSPLIAAKRDRPSNYGSPIVSSVEDVMHINELNSRGVSLLHEAAAKGDAEKVKLLLLHGAEVNRQSLNGSSPLHEAVKKGNAVTASILIEHGADLFTETDNGLLPIDMARNADMKRFIQNAMALK